MLQLINIHRNSTTSNNSLTIQVLYIYVNFIMANIRSGSILSESHKRHFFSWIVLYLDHSYTYAGTMYAPWMSWLYYHCYWKMEFVAIIIIWLPLDSCYLLSMMIRWMNLNHSMAALYCYVVVTLSSIEFTYLYINARYCEKL